MTELFPQSSMVEGEYRYLSVLSEIYNCTMAHASQPNAHLFYTQTPHKHSCAYALKHIHIHTHDIYI